jgi:hypothetical protein
VIVTFDDLFADIKSIIPIVDDSPIVLAKLSDDLAGQYGLITAESGEEIVKILKALPTPVGAFPFPQPGLLFILSHCFKGSRFTQMHNSY